MTIREDMSTRETTRAPALVTMPAFRALPAIAGLRAHPVVKTLPDKVVAGTKGVAQTARDLHGRLHCGLRSCIDALPSVQAIGRAARRETLLFLRDNGFAPLAGLFALSPRLAWAMVLPFAMTSLFGIFIFGIELVLVSALGLFFACLVANDAARRLQEEAMTQKGTASPIPLVQGMTETLPAPAGTPLPMPAIDLPHTRQQPVSANREEA
jgi:hypothetical protein